MFVTIPIICVYPVSYTHLDVYKRQDTFIPQFCKLIRSLTMDWIHVIGDIFDRGPRPDRIMEELIEYGDVDIQWGNPDISWMGAACGNRRCV